MAVKTVESMVEWEVVWTCVDEGSRFVSEACVGKDLYGRQETIQIHGPTEAHIRRRGANRLSKINSLDVVCPSLRMSASVL